MLSSRRGPAVAGRPAQRAPGEHAEHGVVARLQPGDAVAPIRVETGQQERRRTGHPVAELDVGEDRTRSDRRRRRRGAGLRRPGRPRAPCRRRAAARGAACAARSSARSRSRSSSPARVRSHSIPIAPKNAVAARKSSESVRPVWWFTGALTCAPRYSGAISSCVQRWMCWRPSASVRSDVQNRWTCSMTPRSIRPPPLAQLSHSTSGMQRAQPVEHVEVAERLVVDGGRAAAGRAARLDEFAVVVPLHVVDRRARQHGVDLRRRGGRAPRTGQVEHLLVAPHGRDPAAGGEDPVRVRAVEVRVGVDHLRLEPQPELHAQLVHAVRERREPVAARRPARWSSRRDRPASSRRPPNHPSSRTKRSAPTAAARWASSVSRSRSWSKYTASQTLHTTGCGSRGWAGRRALEGVQLPGEPVQPVVGRDEVDPRRRVRRARRQRQLAGQQQLAGTQDGLPVRPPLEEVPGVAAPAEMDAPHLAVAEAEAGGARRPAASGCRGRCARRASRAATRPSSIGPR